MKKFLSLSACALLALSACGQVQKPGITKKDDSLATHTAELKPSAFAQKWGKDLASGCKSHQGYLNADGTQCSVVEEIKTLDGTEKPGTSVDIGDVASGIGILATGNSTANGVLVTLDNRPVSHVPTENNQPILLKNGGHLAFLVNPGSTYKDVRLYTYTCVGVSLNPIACVF